MSRVLARSMFKKKAPKRSARGVGITSMLEDDVPGYAEGGEVNDDRTERERMAEMLLEQGREEFKGFAEGERPQMFRPPATMGMMPQPNPQQMQAAQMQQMAQMGLLPRFQEGGFVQRQPISGWGSRIRGWSEPDTRAGSPSTDNPEFRYREPAMFVRRQPLYGWGSRVRGWSEAEPRGDSELRAENRAEPESRGGWGSNFRGWSEAPSLWSGISSLYTGNPPLPEGVDTFGDPMGPGPRMSDFPLPPGGGRDLLTELGPSDPTGLPGALFGVPRFTKPSAPNEAEQAAMEADRESRRAAGFSRIAEPEKKKAPPPPLPGEKKKDNLQDIKAEREARKAELAAEAAAAREQNKWLAIMQAGLAIAGGRSPNAITNIGQGGQAGLASFMALEQQRRRDEDAAMRRDIAEREYGLQERKLKLMEPVYQAQAMAPQYRMQAALARLSAAQQKEFGNLNIKARENIDAKMKANPLLFMKDGKLDKLAYDTAVANEQAALKSDYLRGAGINVGQLGAGGYGGLALDIPDEYLGE